MVIIGSILDGLFIAAFLFDTAQPISVSGVGQERATAPRYMFIPQIFYINLDARTDRRGFMERQFGLLGLEAERVPAITPDVLPPEALQFCDERRDRWVSPVELACAFSHRRAWQLVVERNLPGALIFEDDA